MKNKINKKHTNKDSNMIGYGSLFSKNKIGHLQIPIMSNILVPIILFFNTKLENSNKSTNYIKSQMAIKLFLEINFHILFILKVK